MSRIHLPLPHICLSSHVSHLVQCGANHQVSQTRDLFPFQLVSTTQQTSLINSPRSTLPLSMALGTTKIVLLFTQVLPQIFNPS